ncbi:MAG TPA: hypothetical protein VJ111_03060 [Chitinophagaceae bacterium]|nr:hypothetical protein [Chitinophagaceae bacterium]
MNTIYLNNATTTRLDEQVLEAMLPYMTSQFGNPSLIMRRSSVPFMICIARILSLPPIEHPAVLNTVEHYTKTGMITSSLVKMLPDGHVDVEDLET